MRKILLVLTKDLFVRKTYWLITVLEILLPVSVLILLDLTDLASVEPPNQHYFNDSINQDCSNSVLYDIFTKITYEPSNNFTNALMKNVQCYGGFQDVKAGKVDQRTSELRIGIKFKGLGNKNHGIPQDLQYELYPVTQFWENLKYVWENPKDSLYSYSYGELHNFFKIQHAIDHSFLNLSKIRAPQLSFQTVDKVSESIRLDKFIILLAFFIGFTLMIPGIVSVIIEEKHSGAKEMMLLMGVKRHQLWIAKFIESFILLAISEFFIVIFMYTPLTESSYALKGDSVSPYFMWLYLMYSMIAVTVFLFFFSCLFHNTTLGVFLAEVVWLTSFLVYNTVVFYSRHMNKFLWILCCFLPNFCFFLGISMLLDFEFYDKEIKFGETLSNKFQYPTFREILIMLTVDIVLYSLLTWYFDNIYPGYFGIDKSYTFCFKESYWISNKFPSVPTPRVSSADTRREIEDFEEVPRSAQVGISVRNVTKEFISMSSSKTLAVDNVTIDFYAGEITSLLGHNGAGKTTLFSMIAGLMRPTSGKVLINGYDVVKSRDLARKSLGLCPQNDMLFKTLNPLETLLFYGMLKGMDRKAAISEANDFIEILKLNPEKKTASGKLSGGQKRKLSLAIALIGGSEIVLLDEPTSGLDPEMRREFWDVVIRYRRKRTILITTHFMEEADALSDRIAIMDHGKIKCYGSPMYLKAKYGSGYTLSIVTKQIGKGKAFEKFIQKFIPTAELKSENFMLLRYKLPQDEVEQFSKLFPVLDVKEQNNEIQSYSVSYSTFEDVYLSLKGDEGDTNLEMVDGTPFKRLNTDNVKLPRIGYPLLPFYQFYALLIKKWIYFSRNYGVFMVFFLYPFLYILIKYAVIPEIEITFNKIYSKYDTDIKGTIWYSLDLYKNTEVFYTSQSPNDNITRAFKKIISDADLGIRRVENIQDELNQKFKEDFHKYHTYIAFALDLSKYNDSKIDVYHNSYAVHMIPVSMHTIYNTVLLASGNPGSITASVNFTYSQEENNQIMILQTKVKDPMAMCFLNTVPTLIGIPALFFILGPMREKINGCKHLQLMATSSIIYWLSHLLFDSILFLVGAGISFVLLLIIIQEPWFTDSKGEILIGFVLFCYASLLINYIVSCLVKNTGMATAFLLSVYLLVSFLVFNLIVFGYWSSLIRFIHPMLIFRIGLNNICTNVDDHFIIELLSYNFVLFGLLIIIDSRILGAFHRVLSAILSVDYSDKAPQDEAVYDHETYVENLTKQKQFSYNSLVVHSLKRWFATGFKCKWRAAVKGISFAVENGECFGLLGVNGAGKSTTFKILTGSLQASKGSAYVNGYNMFLPLRKSMGLQLMGYCPQYGGFIPNFKAAELLNLFARLRGLERPYVKKETTKWMEKMNLMEHKNTFVNNYSGGNQRKLMVAVSLIGDPPVVLLDEPTTGVDPISRRHIWKVINKLRKKGKSVLLTTHSLDECEVVCTRIAIMVNGTFRCLGEIPTLKETFGKGFTVHIKITLDANSSERDEIKEAMTAEFGETCQLFDEHPSVLDYRIVDKNLKLDSLFFRLSKLKNDLAKLESFSASSTSLEQVFISFTKE